MNREDILWLLKNKLNTFECLRDDNIKAHVKHKDAYFQGKIHAYDLAVQNLHNVINAINRENA
jgi:hypothetical protein